VSAQLGFDFAAAPPLRTAEELLARLRVLGMRSVSSCQLTRNRTVMVSWKDGVLRIHVGYLQASDVVLRGIVRFIEGRTARDRAEGRRDLLAFKIPDDAPRRRRREVQRDEDAPIAARLLEWHAHLNDERFGGSLKPIAVKVSRTLVRRLGHYAPATPAGDAPEIVISTRHLRRHGWRDAVETLLHEMVHQWQDETGHPLDHGPAFRRKAREVGVSPRATKIAD
jgi:hypothetical protein